METLFDSIFNTIVASLDRKARERIDLNLLETFIRTRISEGETDRASLLIVGMSAARDPQYLKQT